MYILLSLQAFGINILPSISILPVLLIPVSCMSGMQAYLQLRLCVDWCCGVLVHGDVSVLLGVAEEDNFDCEVIAVSH